MLFPYCYIPNHRIYTLQTWMDGLFLDVWCKAELGKDYNISLLSEELQEITLAIYNDDRITTDYLYGPIEKIYKMFQRFDEPTRELLAKAYRDNNAIEDLCKQQNGCSPYMYNALEKLDAPLRKAIEKLFKSLFTDIIHLKVVKEKIGEIDSHYDEFVTLNDEGKCPFCGLNSIKGPTRSVRDAYDHYLPKDIYPFNSINFKNLAPMCHECNSSHKLRQDPITNPLTNIRRKAFYTYEANRNYRIEIDIKFNNKDILTLTDKDIVIELTSATHQDEVNTWKMVFGIEERYKEKCLSKTEGKYWYMQATDEYHNYPDEVKAIYTQAQWVQKLIDDANKNKYAAGNFIKAKYLEACRVNSII